MDHIPLCRLHHFDLAVGRFVQGRCTTYCLALPCLALSVAVPCVLSTTMYYVKPYAIPGFEIP